VTANSADGSLTARSGVTSCGAPESGRGLRRRFPAHLPSRCDKPLQVPGGAAELRPRHVLALVLERGHARVRAAQLPRNGESPHRGQGREVRFKVDADPQNGIHPQRLVRKPLPVRQESFAGQELFDLPDLALAAVGPEVEAPARRRDRLQQLQGPGPQALPFALALGAGLLFALPALPALRCAWPVPSAGARRSR
jgi:hypothetical protein